MFILTNLDYKHIFLLNKDHGNYNYLYTSKLRNTLQSILNYKYKCHQDILH